MGEREETPADFADTELGFNSLSGNIESLIEVQTNQRLRNPNIKSKKHAHLENGKSARPAARCRFPLHACVSRR
jgi:hypothetical protein